MKHIVILISGLIAAFIILMVGVRLVGARTVPSAMAVLDAGHCASPCWYGVQPGKTTLEQARDWFKSGDTWQAVAQDWPHAYRWALKAADGWQMVVTRDYKASASIIADIEVDPPDGALHVGDILRKYGDPLGMRVCARPRSHVHLYFTDHIEIIAVAPEHGTIEHLDPQLDVEYIFFHDPSSASTTYLSAERWQGFMGRQSIDTC